MLGPKLFQEGLGKYMKKHAYGNTITTDLWSAWSQVSGKNVNEIMSSWTGQMGYPYLTVKGSIWDKDKVELTLEQNWFLADGSPMNKEDSEKQWTIPLLFATDGAESTEAVLMTKKTQSFSLPLNPSVNVDDNYVKINCGQQALARVKYSPDMITRLQSAINKKKISAIDRASVLLDAYALAKAGKMEFTMVVDVLRAFQDDINYTVWSAIAGVLGGLKSMMTEIGGEPEKSFKAFAGNLVKRALVSVGWEPKDTDKHTDKLLRSTIIGLLDTFCSSEPDVVTEARRRFEAHFEDPSALPSDIKTTVYRIVLKAGGVAEYERILATFYSTEDNAEKKYAMVSLGSTEDLKLKTRTLDWSIKSGDVKLQDFFYPIGPVGSNKEGAQLAWTYFTENMVLIEEKLKSASPSLFDAVIVNSCSGFCTLARADEVEMFFKENPHPSSARRIAQCVENMRNNGHMPVKVKKSAQSDSSY
jgi:puromycin-sensitive aminopeptidase